MNFEINTLEELNKLEEFKDYDDLSWNEMPPFFEDVISHPGISCEKLNYFGKKFFLYWFTNKNLRKLVKDRVLLFLKFNYMGVFNSIQDCVSYAASNNVEGRYINIISINPIILAI